MLAVLGVLKARDEGGFARTYSQVSVIVAPQGGHGHGIVENHRNVKFWTKGNGFYVIHDLASGELMVFNPSFARVELKN